MQSSLDSGLKPNQSAVADGRTFPPNLSIWSLSMLTVLRDRIVVNGGSPTFDGYVLPREKRTVCLGGQNTSHTSMYARVQLPKLTNTVVDKRPCLTLWKGTTNDLKLSSDFFISYTLAYTQLHSHTCKHLYNTHTHTLFPLRRKGGNTPKQR